MVKLFNQWLTFKDIKAILKVYNLAKNQKQGIYEYDRQGTFIKYKVDDCHDVEILIIE